MIHQHQNRRFPCAVTQMKGTYPFWKGRVPRLVVDFVTGYSLTTTFNNLRRSKTERVSDNYSHESWMNCVLTNRLSKVIHHPQIRWQQTTTPVNWKNGPQELGYKTNLSVSFHQPAIQFEKWNFQIFSTLFKSSKWIFQSQTPNALVPLNLAGVVKDESG